MICTPHVPVFFWSRWWSFGDIVLYFASITNFHPAKKPPNFKYVD